METRQITRDTYLPVDTPPFLSPTNRNIEYPSRPADKRVENVTKSGKIRLVITVIHDTRFTVSTTLPIMLLISRAISAKIPCTRQ